MGVNFRDFDCDNCGACCRKLIVEADFLDAMREPRLYQIDPRITYDGLRSGEQTVVLLDTQTMACPFLTAECRCDIYTTRPNACVGVEPGDAKCQQAREIAGLPMLLDRNGGTPSFQMLERSANVYEIDYVPFYEGAADVDP